jgi:hypothetical protein
MAPTEYLLACPDIMQILAEIGAGGGRSRLMGLAAGAQVPSHVDSHYYWRTHWRIHIPVITNPDVRFTCANETVHMAPGECWLFDSFRWHKVENAGAQQRVHLVLDTVGGAGFWELIDGAQAGETGQHKTLRPDPSGAELAFERVNSPTIMSPWEMRVHLAFLAEHVVPHPLLGPVMTRLERFVDQWAATWAQFGTDEAGLASYWPLLDEVKRDLSDMGAAAIVLRNRLQLLLVLDHVVFVNAVADRQEAAARSSLAEEAV